VFTEPLPSKWSMRHSIFTVSAISSWHFDYNEPGSLVGRILFLNRVLYIQRQIMVNLTAIDFVSKVTQSRSIVYVKIMCHVEHFLLRYEAYSSEKTRSFKQYRTQSSACHLLLAWFTLRPWRWSRYYPPNYWAFPNYTALKSRRQYSSRAPL
jgi:hypothetical protein